MSRMSCGVFLELLAREASPVEFEGPLVQARAAGAVSGGLAELRKLLRATQPLRRHEPAGDQSAWDRAAARIAPGGRE